MRIETLDTIVIGGGPCGLSVGLSLQREGIDYLILEKGAIANSIQAFPFNMRFYSTSDRLEVGDIPFLSDEERPSRHEALRYYRSVAIRQRMNLRTFHRVTEVSKTNGGFLVQARDHNDKETALEARRIVLATGIFDRPRTLRIPGERLARVSHYYTEGHSYAGRKVVVIGGKNSAVEAAIDLYRNGAEVALVHRGATVYQGIKPTLLLDIKNLIEKRRISFYPDSSPISIDEDKVTIQRGEERIPLPSDFVFSLIGYQPDYRLLKDIDLIIDETTQVPSFDPETYETNVPDLFAAGVITGGRTNKVFIDDGRLHGPVIARVIKERNASVARA